MITSVVRDSCKIKNKIRVEQRACDRVEVLLELGKELVIGLRYWL